MRSSKALTERGKETEPRKQRRKLDAENQGLSDGNRGSTGPATEWKAAWGLSQRQFSLQTLPLKPHSDRQAKAPCRSERRLAEMRTGLEVVRAEYGLKQSVSAPDSPPDSPLKPATLRRAEPMKRKRNLNRRKGKETHCQRPLPQKETVSHSHSTLHKCKSSKKAFKRVQHSHPLSKPHRPESLENRLRDMLKSKVESIRESELSRPLSLGSASTLIAFPADSKIKWESERGSGQESRVVGRRKLKRRPREESTEEDFVESVRRDLGARIIQRWFRAWRLRHRLLRLQPSHLSSFPSQQSSLQFPSSSSVSGNSPCAVKAADRFRDLLSQEYGELSSRFVQAAAQLSACLDRTVTVDESLLTEECTSPVKAVSLLCGDFEEPDDRKLVITPISVYWMASKTPEDVEKPEFPMPFTGILARNPFAMEFTENFAAEMTSPRDFVHRVENEPKRLLKRRSKPSNLSLKSLETALNYPSITEIVIESPVKQVLPPSSGISAEQVETMAEEWLQRELRQCLTEVRVRKPPTVDTSFEFVCYWLELLVAEVQESAFMQTIRTPRKVPFSQILASNVPIPEAIIPEEALQRALQGLLTHITDSDARNQLSAYCQMLHSAANEALDVVRPESTKGQRPPSRAGPTDLHQYSSIYEAFYDVRDLILAWSSGEVGRIAREGEGEVEQIREERVSVQLLRDVLLEERGWVDYEREEVGCRVEVAERLLEELVRETIQFLAP